jgi:hypothetical protein
MKQGENYPFAMQDLVERYGIKRQSLLEYTKNHISELNEDGVHARKFGKEWKFDTVAVKRLDELRGYIGNAIAIIEYESPELARAREAEAELEQVKQRIDELEQELKAKSRTIDMQVQMLADEKANSDQKLLLLTSEAEAKEQEQAKRIEELEADNKTNLDRAMSAEAEVARYKNLNFLERFIYLFKGQ